MSESNYRSYSKMEIAKLQLDLALELYIQENNLLSSITLAGAAEEILGKIAERNGRTPALTRKVSEFALFYETLWDELITTKEVRTLENKARNNLKHLGDEDSIVLDEEREASRIIKRALENYQVVFKSCHELSREFEKITMKNWRAKGGKKI